MTPSWSWSPFHFSGHPLQLRNSPRGAPPSFCSRLLAHSGGGSGRTRTDLWHSTLWGGLHKCRQGSKELHRDWGTERGSSTRYLSLTTPADHSATLCICETAHGVHLHGSAAVWWPILARGPSRSLTDSGPSTPRGVLRNGRRGTGGGAVRQDRRGECAPGPAQFAGTTVTATGNSFLADGCFPGGLLERCGEGDCDGHYPRASYQQGQPKPFCGDLYFGVFMAFRFTVSLRWLATKTAARHGNGIDDSLTHRYADGMHTYGYKESRRQYRKHTHYGTCAPKVRQSGSVEHWGLAVTQ